MAKVHPKTSKKMIRESSSSEMSSDGGTYTVWMKSLVMHSNGCTVFNSNGEIVFRVNNYQTRRSNEVFLMNSNGQLLYSIRRKNLVMSKSWEGYKLNNSKLDDKGRGEWFQVKRKSKLLGNRNSKCKCVEINVGCNKTIVSCFNIVGILHNKSTFKILDCSDGRVLAEMRPKLTSAGGGISLGNDVLTLTVRPGIDHSLIMALVVVHGMINHQL